MSDMRDVGFNLGYRKRFAGDPDFAISDYKKRFPSVIIDRLLRREDTLPTWAGGIAAYIAETLFRSQACRKRFEELVCDADEEGRLVDEESAFRMGVVTGMLMAEVRAQNVMSTWRIERDGSMKKFTVIW